MQQIDRLIVREVVKRVSFEHLRGLCSVFEQFGVEQEGLLGTIEESNSLTLEGEERMDARECSFEMPGGEKYLQLAGPTAKQNPVAFGRRQCHHNGIISHSERGKGEFMSAGPVEKSASSSHPDRIAPT